MSQPLLEQAARKTGGQEEEDGECKRGGYKTRTLKVARKPTPINILKAGKVPRLTASFAPKARRENGNLVAWEDYGLPAISKDVTAEETKRRWIARDAKTPRAYTVADYGTFKDSLRAPIHRWFKYPAGYCYRLVEAKIVQYGLARGQWVLDPFVGSGTTSVEAKRHAISSIGIEAHPFVHWVATTKANWNIERAAVASTFHAVVATARTTRADISELPELVRKCYSPDNLASLLALRNAIRRESPCKDVENFLSLALTDTLRNASKAATGWPYIAPAAMHGKMIEREAFSEFTAQVRRMLDDVAFMQMQYGDIDVPCEIIRGDSRVQHNAMESHTIDLALTSPPYLNNFDYADRTRLETYFFGWYQNWGDITEQVRERLMMSATTQVRRQRFNGDGGVADSLGDVAPELCGELVGKISQLSECRKHKGGKKSYDCMVAGYFNDMLQTLKQVQRVLKRGSDFVLVLGDSAPYGVYIPTHEYLARLGVAVGFTKWQVEELRTRGDKWKGNPQRHKVKLKEVILTLTN